jgi:hypothetical protein
VTGLRRGPGRVARGRTPADPFERSPANSILTHRSTDHPSAARSAAGRRHSGLARARPRDLSGAGELRPCWVPLRSRPAWSGRGGGASAQRVHTCAGTSGKPQVEGGSLAGRERALTQAKVLVRAGTADESACTPGPVPPVPRGAGGGGHPSRAGVATGLKRSTRGLGRAALGRPRRAAGQRPLLTLLRVGFTEPPRSPWALVVSYTTVSPLPAAASAAAGGLFSVALSRGSPQVGVTYHPALWSPDVPRRGPRGDPDAAARPARPPWCPAYPWP